MADLELKARAVEDAVFRCLLNASRQPHREEYWRRQADLLEKKFTGEHGRHYSYFTCRNTAWSCGIDESSNL